MHKPLRGKNRGLQFVRHVGNKFFAKCFEFPEFIDFFLLKGSKRIDFFIDVLQRVQGSGFFFGNTRQFFFPQLAHHFVDFIDFAENQEFKNHKDQQVGG